MARFTFPRNPHSSVLINAGGSAQPDDFAAVAGRPRRARDRRHRLQRPLLRPAPPLQGLLRGGLQPPLRRLRHLGSATSLDPGSTAASDSQAPAANPRDDRRRRRLRDLRHQPATGSSLARVGVSFVSVEDARANLAAENPGLGFGDGRRPRRRALEQVAGPDPRQRRPAPPPRHLLHGALPRLPRAADLQRRRRRLPRHGRARPPRPRPHPVRRLLRLGHLPQRRSSCSRSWRRERASDMVRSLLADAAQSGCLPRWPYANGQSMTMVGDSGRPDHRLRRGLRRRRLRPPRGAGGDGQGGDRALPQRQRRIPRAPGPRPTTSRSATSPSTSTPTSATPTRSTAAPDDVWGSAATTLEYAVDDFAIAQFAARALARPLHLRRLHAPLRPPGAGSTTRPAA